MPTGMAVAKMIRGHGMETLRIREWEVSPLSGAMKEMGELEVADESNLSLLCKTESNLFLNGLPPDLFLLRPSPSAGSFQDGFPSPEWTLHRKPRTDNNPLPTGRTRLLPQAFLILLPQKSWLYPSIDEGPGRASLKFFLGA